MLKKKPNIIRKWFNTLKLSQKLSSMNIFIAAFVCIVIGVVSIIGMIQITSSSQKVYEKDTVPLSPLYKIETDFISIKSLYLEILTNKDASASALSSQIDKLYSDMDKQMNEYSKIISTSQEKENYNNIKDAYVTFGQLVNQRKSMISSGQMEDLRNDIFSNGDSVANQIQTAVDQSYALKINQAQKENRQSLLYSRISMAAFGIVLLLSIAAAFYISKFISKTITAPINKMVKAADGIAKGDLTVDCDIKSNDELGILSKSFKRIIGSLNLLSSDVATLINAALEGKLDERADIEKHNGSYREIIDGVNQSLDAMKAPLDVASEQITKMANGQQMVPIENTYKGYYADLMDNLNNVYYSLSILLKESNKLADAGLNGNLSVRGDTSQLKGNYADIVNGINQTFEAVVDPFKKASEYIEKICQGILPDKIQENYKGDYNVIIHDLNICIDAINSLITDANMLVDATVNGNLSIRAGADKHKGDFRKIIEGINHTLDAVVGPLNVAADCVDNISKGNIPEKITGDYKGDFNTIIHNLNTCIDAVEGLIYEVNTLADGAIEGHLSIRADATRYQGDFRKIIEGVNNTLDAITEPIKESSAVLKEVAKGNLKVNMKGDYKGDHAAIKLALNETISSLSGYIQEMTIILNEISNGNLQVEITSDYLGDFVAIKNSINQIIKSLNGTFIEIKESSEQVAAGAKQVSNASQGLSQATTEQAGSVEQLTTSISQIADQTKKNAESAFKANEITSTVRDDAVSGNEQMKDMLSSMQEINQASSNISKIIKVIDDIAFQTNILSLNAAVEAARAGQAGKGFAVVAEEVRNLAARSANAAKETTELIEGSMKKVEAGTKIANSTAESLNKIVSGVEKTAVLVSNISTASNEQASHLSQINDGIDNVSQIVQMNSATAEQSAAASEELSGQADILQNMVEKFKVAPRKQ